jgi:hypothetical protein
LLFEAHSLQTAKKISTVGQKTAYYPKNRIFARVQNATESSQSPNLPIAHFLYSLTCTQDPVSPLI